VSKRSQVAVSRIEKEVVLAIISTIETVCKMLLALIPILKGMLK